MRDAPAPRPGASCSAPTAASSLSTRTTRTAFVATWQGGIAEVEFPAASRLLPRARRRHVKGVWPRALNEGFLDPDDAAFVADTAYHPRKSGRVLHTRLNRLYGMPATGERWQPEQVGPGIELLYHGTARQPQLEVLPSLAAQHLGLVPQLNPSGGPELPARAVRARGGRAAQPPGRRQPDQRSRSTRAVRFANLAAATAAEVAAYIRANVPAALPTVNAQPYFPPTGLTVEIVTRGVGAGAADHARRLGARTRRAGRAAAARPASRGVRRRCRQSGRRHARLPGPDARGLSAEPQPHRARADRAGERRSRSPHPVRAACVPGSRLGSNRRAARGDRRCVCSPTRSMSRAARSSRRYGSPTRASTASPSRAPPPGRST